MGAFKFELSKDEMAELAKSQKVISIQVSGVKGGRSKPIKAFTEQGIYMLMTVLKGDLAIEQSKSLIRIFKSMKDYLLLEQGQLTFKEVIPLMERIEKNSSRIEKITEDINDINERMVDRAELSDFMKLFGSHKKYDEVLMLDGEPFKADIAYQSIYSNAKINLIVIDDYLGVKTLHHLEHAADNIDIIIISDNKARPKLKLSEYNDFKTENPNKKISFVKNNNIVHDRYIILDNGSTDMVVYHCGVSSKDAGKKITTITQINDVQEYKSTVKRLLANPTLILS